MSYFEELLEKLNTQTTSQKKTKTTANKTKTTTKKKKKEEEETPFDGFFDEFYGKFKTIAEANTDSNGKSTIFTTDGGGGRHFSSSGREHGGGSSAVLTADEYNALLAEEEKKEREKREFLGLDLFQKGAWEGYEPGKVDSVGSFFDETNEFNKKHSQAMLGTMGDVGLDIIEGGLNMVEGITDAAGWILYGGNKYLAKDDEAAENIKKAVEKDTVSGWLEPADKWLEQYSVFGDTTDQVAQGVGQVGATMGIGAVAQGLGATKDVASIITQIAQGSSAFGHGASEAKKSGATDGEALAYGILSAGAEVFFESLTSGSSIEQASGHNRFSILKGLDDKLANKIGDLINNPNARNFVKGMVKGGFEGVEEWLTGVAQGAAKLTYKHDKTIWELWEDENLWEQFFVGALTGDIMQAGDVAKANKSGRDVITGLNADETAVVDKIVDERIAKKAKEIGKDLKGKDKAEIREQVMEDLENGNLDVDDIERIIGGDSYNAFQEAVNGFEGNETYKAYRDALEQEKALQTEFDELSKVKTTEADLGQNARFNELQQKLAELKQKSKSGELRTQLQPEIDRINDLKAKLRADSIGRLKDSKLTESYLELARSDEKFKIDDFSKYKGEHSKQTINNILESGLANNSKKMHRFVDFLAKISDAKGVTFSLADAKKLANTIHDFNGATADGFITGNEITINLDSKKKLNSIVGHEIGHVLKGTEFWDTLSNAVQRYASSKGEWDAKLAKIKETYKKYDSKADPVEEAVVDLIGEYVFTDSKFVNSLSTEHRNVFQKIYDEIKWLAKIATAGSEEKRNLVEVERIFEKAWRDSNTNVENTTKHSISESNQLTAEQEEFFKDSVVRDENGNLKPMYHGTANGGHTIFDTYGSKYGLFGAGSYFTDSKTVAEKYTDKHNERGNNKQVYETYLNIKKPMDMDAQADPAEWARVFPEASFPESGTNEDFFRAMEDYFYDMMISKDEAADEVIDAMTAMGYDGITHIGGNRVNPNGEQHRVYIAFHPEQIKNTDNANPTSDPDIRYSISEDSDGNKLTEAQNDFFKDSLMRDDNGNLIVMYHGTRDGGFHTFDSNYSDDDTSFFFTDRNDVASTYSGTSETYTAKAFRTAEDFNNFFAEIGATEYSVVEENGKFKLLEDGDEIAESDTADGLYEEFRDWTGKGYGEVNYKVYLNLKNPLVVDAKGADWKSLPGVNGDSQRYDYIKVVEVGNDGSVTIEYAMKGDPAPVTERSESIKVKRVGIGKFGLYVNGELTETFSKNRDGWYASKDNPNKYYSDNEHILKVAKARSRVKFFEKFGDTLGNKLRHLAPGESLEGAYANPNTTRDYAKYAKENGYDGVIFKNILDNGGYSNGSEGTSTVGIAFYSNQIKSVGNTNPTTNNDIRYSLTDDTKLADKAIAKNDVLGFLDSETVTLAKAMRERVAQQLRSMKENGVAIPDDIKGNTAISNSSYDITEENTTICPRSLAAESFVDAVSEYLGRPLTVEEQIYISQDLQGRSLAPECTYCYVATDRKAYRQFLGEYIKQRDAVLEKIEGNPNADITRGGELYKDFLNGRKDTDPMYKRFKMWVDAYKSGKPLIDGSHLANMNRLMGDINEFGAELKPQIVDAMKYAQSASWAKKRVSYVAYDGHILKWKQNRIDKLNSHYGLRMYSFSDFHPAFVLENMQMITDAAVRGLKVLGYTKDTDFVEIFAPSGMNINISTFGFESGGNVYENNIIGANWEKAKALREQNPNVGITFVATSDSMVEWALEQDWVDVVIPYHLVRTGEAVANAFDYKNFTNESSDTKDKGWSKDNDSKYIAPTEHNNDKATYLAALERNNLKPRFERWLNNPNYMKLVNECRQTATESRPVQPKFNEDAINTALAKLKANGYYQPVGGSVDRMYEIAAQVAENMQTDLQSVDTSQRGWVKDLPVRNSITEDGYVDPDVGDYAVYGSDVKLRSQEDFGFNPLGDIAPVAEQNVQNTADVPFDAPIAEDVAPTEVAEATQDAPVANEETAPSGDTMENSIREIYSKNGWGDNPEFDDLDIDGIVDGILTQWDIEPMNGNALHQLLSETAVYDKYGDVTNMDKLGEIVEENLTKYVPALKAEAEERKSIFPSYAENQIDNYKRSIAEERAKAKTNRKPTFGALKRFATTKPKSPPAHHGALTVDGKQYISNNGVFAVELNTPIEGITENDSLNVDGIKRYIEKTNEGVIDGNYAIDPVDISLIAKQIPKDTDSVIVVGNDAYNIRYVDAVLKAIADPVIMLSSDGMRAERTLLVKGSNGQAIILPIRITDSNKRNLSYVYRAEKVGGDPVTPDIAPTAETTTEDVANESATAPAEFDAPVMNPAEQTFVPPADTLPPTEDNSFDAPVYTNEAPVNDDGYMDSLVASEPPPAEFDAPVREDKVDQQTPQILTEEKPKAKKKNNTMNKLIELFVDKGAVFERLSKKTKNRELEAKYNFMHYSEARAQQFMADGDPEHGVRGILSIMKDVGERDSDFHDYLYHIHNMDRMTLQQRGFGADKAVFGGNVTAQMSSSIAQRIEAQNPDFRQLATEVYGINQHLRQMMVNEGIISQQTANRWAQMYPHYVPISRADQEALLATYGQNNHTGVNAPVKRATGGDGKISPLFNVMGSRILQTYKAVDKNSFGLELMRTLGTVRENSATDMDGIMDAIDTHENLLQVGEDGTPTFTAFVNGQRVKFDIDKEMYDALSPTNEFFAGTSKIANGISNFRRGLITEYNPVFLATNAIKDAQDVLINSQHPLLTYANMPRAWVQMIGKGKWFKEYMANGGEQNTYFEKETTSFKKKKRNILSIISYANNFIERVPRLAEYIASREHGRSIEVAMLDAARVTTNFAAGGDVTKWANRNGFTFLNASVQGATQQVRNVAEALNEGKKGVLKLIGKTVLAGLPAVLLNGLLWDDDEEYEELSDYVKENYYIVWKLDDGQFVRIPKGRTVAVIQEAFEQMKGAITGDDDIDFMKWAKLAFGNLAPNDPFENFITAPISQAIANKAWHGGEIVPQSMQDVPEAEQYDESTDMFSRWLGEITNISPMKWNYVLDQYSGGVGDFFLPMMTPEAERGGNKLASPWLDKFTTDSVLNNQNVTDFYDLKDELTIKANSSKATDDEILMSKYMSSVNSQLSELYKEKREIQNSRMSDDRKFEEARRVQKEIVETMKSAMANYEYVSYIEDNKTGEHYAHIGGKWFKRRDGEYDHSWEILDKEETEKYLITRNKGDSNYATDGETHYAWVEPDEDDLEKEPYWKKLTDKQVAKQNTVTRTLGITPEEYWSDRGEDTVKMYDWIYDNPEKVEMAKAVSNDFNKYWEYKTYIGNIDAKDENGKTVNGLAKRRTQEYIFNLDIDDGQKMILFRSYYPKDDTYCHDIVDYLNGRDDISYQEMKSILEALDMKLHADRTITWD